ncbi:TIR domain-containing protein [Leptolyngbyaceae cyanobacterium CCMR0082]|uniref:TIR domain-containing protein n=2 Tax=Adonisia TaxID=2950183 RepID=A0A6M0S9C4_9CYAN|nr:TIR domain-containing protein [Adonisia turfae CCMR0082]
MELEKAAEPLEDSVANNLKTQPGHAIPDMEDDRSTQISKPKTVFISYSHDSEVHKERVLELANRLCEHGIDANLDQYEESPPEGWQRWMLNQVESSDYVLVICSETYNRRFRAKEEVGRGRGVTWEGGVIIDELHHVQAKNLKFIPVTFTDNDSHHIPSPLASATVYNLSQSDGYEHLYRRLTDQPFTKKPQLGKPIKLDSRESKSEGGTQFSPNNPGAVDRSAQTDENTAALEDDVIKVALERQFPEDVAIVYVEERNGELILKAFNARQTSLEPLEPSPVPSTIDIDLSELLASNSLDIIVQLKSYRPGTCVIGQFFGWLRELRKTLHEESQRTLSCVIINDRTRFNLPWEMLHLPKQETLGTIAQIVHWHDVQDPDTWEWASLPAPQQQVDRCRGRVLMYADTEEIIAARCGLTLLQKYRRLQFTDSKQLLEHWQQTDTELGLIYFTGQGLQDISLDELKARLDYTSSLQYRPSVVFIDMSLPTRGESIMTYPLLAAAFLENGVKGVVGRLGTVRDEQAASILDSFFAQHHRDREAPIPELLRRLRLEALQRLRSAFNEENCLLYLATCLYTYSGNQMTVLDLATEEDTAHG